MNTARKPVVHQSPSRSSLGVHVRTVGDLGSHAAREEEEDRTDAGCHHEWDPVAARQMTERLDVVGFGCAGPEQRQHDRERGRHQERDLDARRDPDEDERRPVMEDVERSQDVLDLVGCEIHGCDQPHRVERVLPRPSDPGPARRRADSTTRPTARRTVSRQGARSRRSSRGAGGRGRTRRRSIRRAGCPRSRPRPATTVAATPRSPVMSTVTRWSSRRRTHRRARASGATSRRSCP